MNQRIILFTLIAFFCNLVTFATEITESEAFNIANNFFKTNSKNNVLKHTNRTITLAHKAITSKGTPVYYVYNQGACDGFVIISGDDKTRQSVLGYSDTGSFDYDNMPENMRWWLNQYENQILYLQNKKIAYNNNTSTTLTSSVEPLLGEIKWDQYSPYNSQCPIITYTNGVESKAATGCVATATAQIMYYHKYPEQGFGSHSYEWGYNGITQTLSADFSQSKYDWDTMLPYYYTNSPQESINAVAKLMSDVGIATETNYGPESSTSILNAGSALLNYFGYDKAITALDRELYSLSEWEQIMRNELDEARPILYRGTGDGSIGHAFVCDGYNTNGYFHINWGWSGNANGYFLTTALTPYAQETTSSYDGYNYYQAMVIGIQKAEENSIKAPVIMSGTTMYAEADEYNLGEFAKIHISSLFGNHMENIQLYMAMLVVDNEGNTVCGYTQASDSPTELKMNYGWNNWGVSFLLPSTLKDGTYTVKPCYRINEETSFRQVKFPIYHPQYLVMKVEENKVYFSFPENFTPNLNVNEIHATSAITNMDFTATAAITNTGDCEYYGNVYMAIMKDSEIINRSDECLIDLETNKTTQIKRELIAPNSIGDYTIVVIDENDNIIQGTSLTITVDSPNLIISDLHSDKALVNKVFRITTTITNSGNCEYNHNVFAAIIKDNEIINTSNEVSINLNINENTTITSELTAPEIAGDYTIAILYEDGSIISGSKKNITIEEIETEPILTIAKELSAPTEMSPDNIHATASITNTGGYFTGYIPMIIINTEGYYYYANTVYQYVTLEQNETKTIEFQGNMSVDIEFGATYYLALLDPITGNALGNIVKFILKDEISNLDNIEIDTNTPIEYYNLQGVKVENPENGIFIRKQGSKTTKVIM